MAFLIIEKGERKGETITLRKGCSILFGRDKTADLRVNDPLISRAHFRCKEHNGSFYVKDLKSSNGTYVNDVPIDAMKLKDGDRIQAGETCMTFLAGDSKEMEELVGKTIGGYRILERIGRGGMGTVYRAMQLSLNREVALKVLSPGLVKDTTFISLFKKEAQAAGQLNHPNIVQVYDVGQEGDLYFYSMEFIAEGSVQNLIKNEKRLPVEEALRVIVDAARGLDYAERKGIVHRDIKPDNLMIHEDGVIKISDLGLAKRTHDEGAAKEEGVFGTPHFISPEQAMGKKVDTRSDIYSLGATFYRILTGRTPFQGTKIQEIIAKQIREDPLPVRVLNSEVPEDMTRVIDRMMRKNPDERYPHVQDLLADLQEVQKRHHYRLTSKGKRGWRTAAAAVIILAGLVLAYLFVQNNRPENNNGNAGKQMPTKKTAPNSNTDEALKDERLAREEAEAKALLLEVRREVDGLAEDVRISPDTARKFLQVWEKYSNTKGGKEAREEAERIHNEWERKEEVRLERKKHQIEEVKQAEREIESLVEKDRFGDAYVLCNEKLLSGEITEEEPKGRIEYLLSSILQTAEGKIASLKRTAATLEEEEKLEEAKTVFQGILESFLPVSGLGEKTPPFFTNVHNLCRQEITRLEEKILERLRSLYHGDLNRFYSKALPVENALSQFDMETSRRLLQEGVGLEELKTPEYKEHVQRWLTTIERGVQFFVTFVERANRKDLSNLVFPLNRIISGFTGGEAVEANLSWINLKYKYGEIRCFWNKYPEEMYAEIFNARWDYSLQEQLGLACFYISLHSFSNAKDALSSLSTSDSTIAEERDRLLQDLEREEKAQDLLHQADAFLDAEKYGEAKEKLFTLKEEYSDTRIFLRNSSGSTHIPKGVTEKLIRKGANSEQ